jgi:hypothetical protein
MSEVLETDGFIIVNLEEGESFEVLIEVAKKHPNRQVAVSIGKRITAETLMKAAADHMPPQAELEEVLRFQTTSRTRPLNKDFWIRGESRDPKRSTSGLPYRQGKGKSR